MASHILNVQISSLIDSPFQGRFLKGEALKNIHSRKLLNELAQSIKSAGLMQPISVRQINDEYEIIDGHRRVEAFKMLDMENIPSIIMEKSDREIQIMTVVANLQRANLSNIERALSFQKILNNGVFENRRELSKAIGKDETYVGDIINLLKMDKRIINDLADNNTTNDVRLLRMIRNSGELNSDGLSDVQYNLYNKCTTENLTRAQLNKLLNTNKNTTDNAFTISLGQKGYLLKIKRTLTNLQKQKLESILEKKIQESLDELLG